MKKQLNRIIFTIMIGASCGVAYQIYKWELGVDTFWNIRLGLLLCLGVLSVYALQYIDLRLFVILAKSCDLELERAVARTYLPLVLLPVYPLQKKLFLGFWPRPLFSYFIAISLALVLLLKVMLLVESRKKKTRGSYRKDCLPGKLSLCLVSIGFAVLFYCFHQFTLIFDFFHINFLPKTQSSFYISDLFETRKAYTAPVRLVEKIPFEEVSITVAYKILDFSREIWGEAQSVPFLFKVRITDEDGTALVDETHVVDLLDEDARKWKEIKTTISKAKGETVLFSMEMRPFVSAFDPRFLLRLFLHNPLDFSYFRGSFIKAAWSEPEIVGRGAMAPRIFLFSIDTLRPDRLGCYGNPEGNSPAIDMLAKEAILYENAFCQSTWTLPSHFSLFTSRFPNEIPTVLFRLVGATTASAAHLDFVPDLTLAQSLK